MTKYIRSAQKLTVLIKEVFAACEISIDTRAIVLLLAGTMPSDKFNLWIDQIPALRALASKYKAINIIKGELGIVCSQYIFLTLINKIDHDVSSSELQQFISGSQFVEQAEYLQPALVASELNSIHNLELPTSQDGFEHALQMAKDYFIHKFTDNAMPHLNAILDVYTHCRQHTTPEVSFYVIVHAMADILVSNGMQYTQALLCSNKLATHSLKELIHSDSSNKFFTCLYDTSVNRVTGTSLR